RRSAPARGARRRRQGLGTLRAQWGEVAGVEIRELEASCRLIGVAISFFELFSHFSNCSVGRMARAKRRGGGVAMHHKRSRLCSRIVGGCAVGIVLGGGGCFGGRGGG